MQNFIVLEGVAVSASLITVLMADFLLREFSLCTYNQVTAGTGSNSVQKSQKCPKEQILWDSTFYTEFHFVW